MAATLTDTGELTYASFPIEKIEANEDGDLVVYGKATDGSVDSDSQIVDPAFAAKAIGDWKTSGANLRVQHNPQRDPAGIGIDFRHDGDATWVKSLVIEPIAKKLVAKGALRAYSVGIAHPVIERDVSGRARGGIIKGGQIVEISLVDRPANKSCGIQLVKAHGSIVEYTGKVFGSDESIEKALTTDPTELFKEEMTEVFKETVPALEKHDISSIIDFTPNDLAELLKNKIIKQHYAELADDVSEDVYKAISDDEAAVLGKDHREFSAEERRHQAAQGNSLPDGSYPIPDTDALRRAAILARSGHGNAAAARRLIARRARELGVGNPLEGENSKEVVPDEVKLDQNGESGPAVSPVGKIPGAHKPGEPLESPCPPSVSKADMPECGDGDNDEDDKPNIKKPNSAVDSPKAAMKPKKGKKLPPWLNKPSGGDGDSSCKMEHEHTEKCHTPPDAAAGVSGHNMQAAPVPSSMPESPAKPHMKGLTESAYMRFKTVGIDSDMGMLHDMTCPAYHPDDVSKYYPLADFTTLIDEDLWQRKALTAATGKSLSEAMEAQQVWQAAILLKGTDQGLLNDFRVEAYKAFRDANPGPSSYPTPGSISAERFNRPVLGGGHAQNSSGYGSPNSSPHVASGAPNAHHFDRPPLGAGHQSPSPSFMKGGFEYPTEQGVPTHIQYAEIEKEKARRALSMLHDHMIHMFTSVCPMLDQDAYAGEAAPTHSVTPVGKAAKVESQRVLDDVYKDIRKLQKKVERGEISEDQARNELARKTAKRYARDLTKQVQDGITSIDEVKKALGIEESKPAPKFVPSPSSDVSQSQIDELQAALQKIAGEAGYQHKIIVLPPGGHVDTREGVTYQGDLQKGVSAEKAQQVPEVDKGLTPDVMKTMMSEILEPFQAKIDAQEKIIQDQQAKLSENSDRWEALAQQPDPATVAFAGLALNPFRRPAGVVEKADMSEQVQGMMMRQLDRTWRTSEIPAEREAAWAALQRLKGMSD